jgi:cyclomaltodextrinase / maltogenic alpha-amylase / neopullulanase
MPNAAWMVAVYLFLFSVNAVAGLKPGAVAYGVVPPFFGERPLQGVTAKLDYLKSQGIDALWISPLHPTDDPGPISYSVTDHFGLRADFGSEGDLRRLVKEAHKRGMKVLLDFVPNHTSHGHPYFLDAQAKGRGSSYFGFFQRDEKDRPVHYFDWEHLPNLNFDRPEVVRLMEDAFLHWVKEFDLDGFRVDVAWGVKDRAPHFWPALRKKLEALKPGIIMLAEGSARDPYFTRNGFDFAYDWTEGLGQWAWKGAFDEKGKIAGKLALALRKSSDEPEKIARFLNNNDTGRRFISTHGSGFVRVASVLQHTVPGLPIVYSGDEVGAEFDPYEQYAPISWQDPHGLTGHYRRLAEIREELPALQSSDWQIMLAEGDLLGYWRGEGKKRVLVLLNFGAAKDAFVTMEAGDSPRAWVDAISGTTLKTCPPKGADACFRVPAHSGWVLPL